MAAIARDLKYTEKDLVVKISKHFGIEIRNLIRSITNETFPALLESLQELDVENRIIKNNAAKRDDDEKPANLKFNKNNQKQNNNEGNNNNQNHFNKKPEYKRNNNAAPIQTIAEIHKVNNDDEILTTDEKND